MTHAYTHGRYVVLFRWEELKAWAARASVAWPYHATKRLQFDEFKRRYVAIGISQLDEHGNNIEWMESALFPPSDVQDARPLDKEQPARRASYGIHWPL